mgnify:FL=1|tara:strand:- start:1402 stop:2361 length:960 start_codon:yes stop_codon:yes gene_type:complete
MNFFKNIFRPIKYRHTVSILANIKKPPWGGANQFFLALSNSLKDQEVKVLNNYAGSKTPNYILHAKWFNQDILARQQFINNCKTVIHRIDGPISLVRGCKSHQFHDDECFEINKKYATKTVIQSKWSFDQIKLQGYSPVNPVILSNSPDPSIFNNLNKISFSDDRKIRLVATSWSDNPLKGGPIYKWLDENLDKNKFQFTFVGRTSEPLKNSTHIPPTDSITLASILNKNDIYITASKNDPCSNALLEGLACGLPALYLNSGAHSELVKKAGLPFNNVDEINSQLNKLIENYLEYQKQIDIPDLDIITTKWIELFESVE